MIVLQMRVSMDGLLDLKNIYSCGWLYSACLFNIYNNIYIITSNCNYEGRDIDSIKLFDLNGKNIKKIYNSADLTYFMLTFMAANGVTPKNIISNLASRTK